VNPLARLKISRLVRTALSGGSRFDRLQAVAGLGRMPPCPASIGCLARLAREDNGVAPKAVESLGFLADPEATRELLALAGGSDLSVGDLAKTALGHPRHAAAAPGLGDLLAAAIRRGKLDLACVAALGRMGEAGRRQLAEMAPLVLACGLKAASAGRLDDAAGCLEFLDGRPGDANPAARSELARAMVPLRLSGAITSGDFDRISEALDWLRRCDLPEAKAALESFARAPSRRITRILHGVYEDDPTHPLFGKAWERTETLYSSALGQAPGPEELGEARRRDEAQREARQFHEEEAARKRERERRERAFLNLLAEGSDEDVADFARSCLEEPASTPGIHRLGDYLGAAEADPRAAELRRRLAAGDPSKLADRLLKCGSRDGPAILEALGSASAWEWSLESERAYWHATAEGPRGVTDALCRRYPEAMAGILAEAARRQPHRSPGLLAACRALAECDDPGVRALEGLLSEPAWTLRREAVETLLRLGTPQARGTLAAYVGRETDHELKSLVTERLGSAH